MDIVRLVGLDRREYEQNGQHRVFTGLHVVYENADNPVTVGQRADNFSCPRDIDPNTLRVGGLYELRYMHYQTKNGLAARIAGLEEVIDE